MKFYDLMCRNIRPNMYKISEYGDVYSEYKQDIMKPKHGRDGYLAVVLRTINNVNKTFFIHTLVLVTFCGEYPSFIIDPTVNHIDGNIYNNHYSNLEWMERSVNSSIRNNKGTGELNHEAKLSNDDVLKIVNYIKTTELSFQEIGKLFNVDKSTINNIVQKKNWSHLIGDDNLSQYRKWIRDKETGRFSSYNPFASTGA